MAAHATQARTFLIISVLNVTPIKLRDLVIRPEGPLGSEISRHGGRVFDVFTHRISAVFDSPVAAVQALLAGLQKLTLFTMTQAGETTFSAAIHHGLSVVSGSSYSGETLRQVRYLLDAAQPGQHLLSQAAVDELDGNLPPSLSLQDLGFYRLKDLTLPRRIYQLMVAGQSQQQLPLRTLDSRPHNLPILASSLIGRERDVEQISALVAEPQVRVVTLMGPSGTGKSRLALQLAAEMLEQFVDGAYFVPLTPIDDIDLLIPAIARALGVQETGARPLIEILKSSIEGKELLLILDNFEQLVQAAPLVVELVAAAPRLKVVVTSQLALHIEGEQVVELPALGLPASSRFPVVESLVRFPAIALFIERARLMASLFELNSLNAADIAAICLHLEGLPLAIELVAAYSDRFTPAEMLEQLQATVAPRDDQHTRRSSLRLQQRTLRIVLEWSYQQLEPRVQALFARLGIFVGGATTSEVLAICGAGEQSEQELLHDMALLARRGLLVRETNATGDLERWSMLDMVHDYAAHYLEQRGDIGLMRTQHGCHFLDVVARIPPGGEGSQEEMDRLEHAYDNVRAALLWGLAERNLEQVLRATASLWEFWRIRGYQTEGQKSTLAILAETAELLLPERARVLYGAGWLALDRGDYGQSRSFFSENLTLSRAIGDRRGIGMALQGLGEIAHLQCDYASARAWYEEAFEILQEQGDKKEMAWALDHAGRAAQEQGDLEGGRLVLQRAVALFQEENHRWGLLFASYHLAELVLYQGDISEAQRMLEECHTLSQELELGRGMMCAIMQNRLGEVAVYQGELEKAERLLAQSLALSEECGYAWSCAHVLRNQGYLWMAAGQLARATECFKTSLGLQRSLEQPYWIVGPLERLAAIALLQQDFGRAGLLYGAAEHLRELKAVPLLPLDRAQNERCYRPLRHLFEEKAFVEKRQQGRTLDLQQMLALALEAPVSLAP